MSFEAPLIDLWNKVQDIEHDPVFAKELEDLRAALYKKTLALYEDLRPIQKVEIARHPNRPHSISYITNLFTDFFSISGDRTYGEDRAIICGFANFRKSRVIVISQEKGDTNESRKLHNYGCPMPEGYRKAIRAMEIANELQVPIISFVDTPGAYPGPAAEERGQGYALADCLATLSKVQVPVISIIIGEGGSGGAIAIAAANKVLMLQNAMYSVITPEGCASILWQAKDKKGEAAEAQKLTAQDLYRFQIIDEIIKEPLGGAHRDPDATIATVGDVLESYLNEYKNKSHYPMFKDERVNRYKKMGERIQVIR